jgi:predicted dehydrogenase
MKRLGIIGAENSHTAAIAKLLNVEQAFPEFRVTHVWGETAEFAQKAAEAGQIPTIVADPAEMLGQVDCIMADHRDGRHHVAAVTPFVEAGVPVFVDKPLSTSLAEAKRFLRLRRKLRVPVTTLSSVPHQASVAGIRQRLQEIGPLRTLHLCGPGDPDSPYSGVFFYGIHQVDLMVELLGVEPVSVMTQRNGKAFTAVVSYPNELTVTISMPGGVKGFLVGATGGNGVMHVPVANDANPYQVTTGLFTRMFETGTEPFDDRRMLAPVAVLEAIQKSLLAGGRAKKIARV